MDPIFSVEAVASLLNKTPGEITEALKESDQNDRDNWLKKNVESHLSETVSAAVVTARSKGHDEGHGRAMRESLTNAEKKIREKYSVEGDNLDDLIEAVANKSKTESKANPDDVKNSPVFIEMETEFKKRIKELNESIEAEKQARSRDSVMAKVKTALEPKLVKMGYKLPEDPERKSRWINVILKDLEDDGTKLSLNSEGEILVLGADGKVKTDEKTMLNVSFDDRLSSVAGAYLDVDNSDGKDSPGNKTPVGGKPSSFDFSSIKTPDDYVLKMQTYDIEKDADEIKALENYYQSAVSSGAIAE